MVSVLVGVLATVKPLKLVFLEIIKKHSPSFFPFVVLKYHFHFFLMNTLTYFTKEKENPNPFLSTEWNFSLQERSLCQRAQLSEQLAPRTKRENLMAQVVWHQQSDRLQLGHFDKHDVFLTSRLISMQRFVPSLSFRKAIIGACAWMQGFPNGSFPQLPGMHLLTLWWIFLTIFQKHGYNSHAYQKTVGYLHPYQPWIV